MEYFSKKTNLRFKTFNSIEEIKKIMVKKDIDVFSAIHFFEKSSKFNKKDVLISAYEIKDVLSARTYNSLPTFSLQMISMMATVILNTKVKSLKKLTEHKYLVNDLYYLKFKKSKRYGKDISNYFYDFRLTIKKDEDNKI